MDPVLVVIRITPLPALDPYNAEALGPLRTDIDSILEIPMPTVSKFMPPLWHTAGYVFGWKYLTKNLKKIIDKEKPFHYLIHPADFLDKKELDPKFTQALERMSKINYSEKVQNLEDVLSLIISNGYEGVKLIDIAKHYRLNEN